MKNLILKEDVASSLVNKRVILDRGVWVYGEDISPLSKEDLEIITLNLDKKIGEVAHREKNDAARQYLKDTDWYIVRLTETGKEVPDAIVDAREKARGSVK